MEVRYGINWVSSRYSLQVYSEVRKDFRLHFWAYQTYTYIIIMCMYVCIYVYMYMYVCVCLALRKASKYAQNWNPFYYNSHTQALSRHSDKIAIDKQVCFYRRLYAYPIKLQKTKTDPVGLLRSINGMVCCPKLFCWMSAWLWYGQGLQWSSVWPAGLCLLAVLTHPPTPSTFPTPPLICSTCDIADCVQNVSQNQPVQPVAMYPVQKQSNHKKHGQVK